MQTEREEQRERERQRETERERNRERDRGVCMFGVREESRWWVVRQSSRGSRRLKADGRSVSSPLSLLLYLAA